MATLKKFIKLHDEFGSVADFLIVYIAEAHPAESKHYKENINITTHKNEQARIKAASKLRTMDDFPFPLVADVMTDRASKDYGAVPERVHILQSGVVKYHCATGPYGYKIQEVEDWLSQHRKQKE